MTKYAALIQESVYIEGDERSRTHPGHGYPGHTRTFDTIKTFKDYDEMFKWVTNQETRYNKTKYTIIQYEELNITVEVKVEVKKS